MAIQYVDVADKTTLDSVKTDTTTLKGMGGIKYNSTTSKSQVYDTTNSTWVDLEVGGGGGASPTLIITNPNHELDNVDMTIASQNRLFTTVKNMGTNDYIVIELPWLGIYYVKGNSLQTVDIETCGGVLLEAAISYPTFNACSDEELQVMLDFHYQDIIDLSTIWSVGDTRKISLSSFFAPNPDSAFSWAAQDIIITILDFNHTDLATSINGHTKAALTLQTREVLSGNSNTSAGTIYINGDSGYDTIFTKWSNLYMRTYMNNQIYSAFPSEIKSLIKPSNHYRHTNYNDATSEQVTDNLFLPSYPEIFGTASYGNYVATSPVEGTQFKYYETAANRIKYNNNNGSKGSSAQNYWMGSASSYYDSSYGYYWCDVNASGSANFSNGHRAYGLAPAFAM